MKMVSELSHDQVADLTWTLFGVRVSGISDLGHGWNDVWRVDGDNGSFVLRRSGEERMPSQVQFEHTVLATLAKGLEFVEAPLEGRNNETLQRHAEGVFSLFRFVPGVPADPINVSHRRAAAECLGQLHRVTSSLEVEPAGGEPSFRTKPLWAWSAVRRLVASHASEEAVLFLDRAHADVEAWVSQLDHVAPRLGWGIVHGDIKPGNVLMSRNTIQAVIDWGFCRHDWYVWEVAWAAATFSGRLDGVSSGDTDFHLRGGVDVNAVEEFVDSYLEAGGVINSFERTLLHKFISVTLLNEVWVVLEEGEPARVRANPDEILREIRSSLEHLNRVST